VPNPLPAARSRTRSRERLLIPCVYLRLPRARRPGMGRPWQSAKSRCGAEHGSGRNSPDSLAAAQHCTHAEDGGVPRRAAVAAALVHSGRCSRCQTCGLRRTGRPSSSSRHAPRGARPSAADLRCLPLFLAMSWLAGPALAAVPTPTIAFTVGCIRAGAGSRACWHLRHRQGAHALAFVKTRRTRSKSRRTRRGSRRTPKGGLGVRRLFDFGGWARCARGEHSHVALHTEPKRI